MNNPQTVEEIVRGFENDFRDYLDASILHYEVSGRPLSSEDEIEWLTKKVNGLITQDRLAHKTAMLEAIKGEKEKLATYGALNARRAGHNIKKILAIGKLQALDRAEDIINKIYE